jgi:putative FmdB family regulatory protein
VSSQMPSYAYRCVECMTQFRAFHGFHESARCPACNSGACERIPSVGFSVSGVNNSDKKAKVGEKVEKFIKEAKQEVQEQKRKLEDER